MFLSSLSRHNKDLERRTLKPSARYSSRVLDKPCYSSQANECYSSVLFRRQQETPSSKREGMPTQRREEKRVEECASTWERVCQCAGESVCEREPFGSSFYMFFLPLGLPYANWASQECCLFYLRSSLWSSDLLCSIFMGFSFSCLLATTILDSFFLF